MFLGYKLYKFKFRNSELTRQEPLTFQVWGAISLVVIGILILIRIGLSSRLPSYIIPIAGHDDGWVFRQATFILKGEWLGPYDQYTLIKGSFSPLFLAFTSRIGVTFSGFNTALYCFACLVFIETIRPIIKSNWLRVFCFTFLLFNPIPYALETGQRIYRTGMGQWEILLIFSCLIAVYFRRNEIWTSLIKWVLLCGVTLGAFLQTREDGAWIYPFVLGVMLLTVTTYILEGKRGGKQKIILFLFPIVIALLLKVAMVIANYSHYGAPILNDRSEGAYSRVAGDLYLIAPNEDEDKLYRSGAYADQYYNIYVSSMEKAFAASPTLNSIAQHIREGSQKWIDDVHPETGQLPTDHMLFALRDGVKLAGYYQSLPETEIFYDNVHRELQAAFDSGALLKRGFPISPLIVPLQKGDLETAISLMPAALKNIANFQGVGSAALPSIGSEDGIKEIALLAGGDYFLGPPGLFIIGSGWALAHDNDIRLTAGLYDKQGVLITALPFKASDDVYNLLFSKGLRLLNAKTARFSFMVEGYDINSGLTLRFFDEKGNLFREIPINAPANCVGDGSFDYCFDDLRSVLPEKKFFSRFIDRANYVIGIYQKVNPYIALLACLAYFSATIVMSREIIKGRKFKTLPVWFVMTGLVLVFILFMFGMCIIQATSFPTLIYMYTAPAYILLMMFCAISVCWGLETILEYRKS